MAKRILAIIMALVLSLSLLSVEMFAAASNPSITKASDTSVTVTWSAVSGAGYYTVQLRRDNANYGTAQGVNGTSNLSYTATNLSGGTWGAIVTSYDRYGGTVLDTSSTSTVNLPISSSSNGRTITISGTTGSITVSWTALSDVTVERFDVDYVVRLSNNTTTTRSTNTSGTSTTLSLASGETLVSVTIYYTVTGQPRQTYGSANASTSGGYNPGQSGTQTGSVGLSGTTLYWTAYGNTTNYVYYQVPGSTYLTLLTNTRSASYNVSSILSRYAGYAVTFYVYSGGPYNQGGILLGSASSNYYYPGYGQGGYYPGYGTGYGVTAYVNNNTLYLSWYPTGAQDYLVSVKVSYATASSYQTGGATTYSMPFTYGNTLTITVYALNNGNVSSTVGTVTINGDGTVGGNSSYYPGTSNNGNYVTGNNCSMQVGTTSSTITWNPTYASVYVVYYTNNDTGVSNMVSANGTSANIPLGSSNCSSFTVNVFSITASQMIASATYNRSYTNNNGSTTLPTASSTKNLTLTEKSSSTTTVSWDAVDNVQYYQIVYYRLDNQSPIEDYIARNKTSYDLPLGRRIGFVVYVYAVTNANRTLNVGNATHLAGDAYPSVTSKDDDDTTTISEYVTGLKGTASSKQVLLSWNAASGNPTYTIYWKRSSSSEWKKAGTTKKKAVTIKGLNNGVTYDFKVVANGHDSGILSSLAPQSSGSTTKTAPDPAGAGTTTSSVPVITSVTGGSGSISVSWTGITNGKAYKIYVAENGSSTYKLKATVSGTSATITGLSAGTYKVRIKGTTTSMSNITSSTKWTELADCDYRSVTVK